MNEEIIDRVGLQRQEREKKESCIAMAGSTDVEK